MKIFNIADPTNPALIGEYRVPDAVAHVAVEDGLACIAGYDAGFWLLDVSDPTRPEALSFVEMADAERGDAEFWNGHLYYTGGGLLQVFDAADPKAPALVGTLAGFGAREVEIRGGLAHATNGRGVKIADVSDPLDPVLLGASTGGEHFGDSGLALADDYAYVGTGSDGPLIVDISDPAAPWVVSRLSSGELAHAGSVAIAGDALVTSLWYDGIRVLDISDRESPALAGSYEDVAHILYVRAFGRDAFITGYRWTAQWIDVSDPANPSYRSEFGQNVRDLAFDGRFAYVAEEDVLNVYDLAGGAPTRIGNSTHVAGIYRLALYGQYLYAARNASGGGPVEVFEVSDPSTPRYVSSFWILGTHWLEVQDGRLYHLSRELAWFSVFDLTDPATPMLLGSIPARGDCFDAAIARGHAYLQSLTGIDVLDVRDPANIQPGVFLQQHGQYDGIATDGHRLITSTFEFPIYDLRDPGRPALAAVYDPGIWNTGVEADAGLVYFATTDGGIDIATVRRRGDLNGDERIDIHDLAGLLAAYGAGGGDAAFDRYADVNEDGCVTLSDLVDLLAVYGT